MTHRPGFLHDVVTVPASGAEEAVPAAVGAPWDGKPAWSAGGRHLLLVSNRGGSLWRVPIDEKSGRTLGEPEPLTSPATEVDQPH